MGEDRLCMYDIIVRGNLHGPDNGKRQNGLAAFV